jgi:hypothetical protein
MTDEAKTGQVFFYEKDGVIGLRMGAFVHANFTSDQAAVLLRSLQDAMAKLPVKGPRQ